MENQSQFSLPTEEILASHRHWITKSYCEDHKTEEEILTLLRESGRNVTVEQIHSCLISWSILPSPYISLAAVAAPQSYHSYEPSPRSTSHSTLVPSPSSSIKSHELHQFTHPYPDSPILKPSHPSNTAPFCSTPSTQDRDRLKVQCYHGDEHHEAETTLDWLPDGPSQLEIYEAEDNLHEKLAVRLERGNIRRDHIFQYKRAAEAGETDVTAAGAAGGGPARLRGRPWQLGTRKVRKREEGKVE